jgi:hypothetical protein
MFVYNAIRRLFEERKIASVSTIARLALTTPAEVRKVLRNNISMIELDADGNVVGNRAHWKAREYGYTNGLWYRVWQTNAEWTAFRDYLEVSTKADELVQDLYTVQAVDGWGKVIRERAIPYESKAVLEERGIRPWSEYVDNVEHISLFWKE